MDTTLLKEHSKPGPRYTSYPSAALFNTGVDADCYGTLLRRLDRRKPVSLYFHIPFCRNICYFCACNVIYTRNYEKAEPYVDALIHEMDLVSRRIGFRPVVDQLHLGGGTPSFLSAEQLKRLMSEIRARFDIEDCAEISIELDPRETSVEQVSVLAQVGFNRASFGVQDFDPDVQRAVNRIQSEELVQNLYQHARTSGFGSLNFDLIYGLPGQTLETFSRTIRTVIDMHPDRISVFNFAYVPWLKQHQQRIVKEQLPNAETRLAILDRAITLLQNAGYVHVGMDHFALPDDELTRAFRDGTLRRNFQGYSTRGGSELIGFGVSSIGEFKDGYVQNVKGLLEYYSALAFGDLATERGLILTADDKIRKAVIRDLITNMRVNFLDIEKEFECQFGTYFEAELRALSEFVERDLVQIDNESISITEQGRFMVRNICMTFDASIQTEQPLRFSNTV